MALEHNFEQKLYDLLDTRNFNVETKGSDGRDALPSESRIFSFDYVSSTGRNYGTMVIALTDNNEMTVMYGDNLGRAMEDPQDREEFFQFQHQLKQLAQRNRWDSTLTDISKLKKVQAGMAAIREGLFEGYYGTRKISYSGEPTQARLMIRHKRDLEEGDARYRYVDSIFIETVQGERFKLPFTNLAGARAMLEHVRQGGTPYDIRGNHITECVTEIAVLNRFNRAAQRKVMEGVTQELVSQAQDYYQQRRQDLRHMGTSRGYRTYFESWHPATLSETEELVEDIKTLFIEQTLDARIEAALPLLARIQQQGTDMKEARIFESWMDNLAEGTWALPETPEQQNKLRELMSQELPVGADGTNATTQLHDLVGDDQLFDIIQGLAADDPDVNVWDSEEVKTRMEELGIDMGVLAPGNVPTQGLEEPEQPVSEETMDEADDISTFEAIMKNAGLDEAAKCNHTMEGEMCPKHGLRECGMHEGQNDDPMNYNAAITGSYYESEDQSLQRLRELALGR